MMNDNGLIPPEPAVYDDELYEKLEKIILISPVTYFAIDLDKAWGQFKLFKLGQIENPELTYPLLKPGMFEQELLYLKQLMTMTLRHPVKAVREIYLDKVFEKELELKMIEAAAACNMDEFLRCNRELMGDGDGDLFKQMVATIRIDIERYVDAGGDNSSIKNLGETLNAVAGGNPLSIPSQDDFDYVKSELSKRYAFIEELITEKHYDAYEIKTIFESVFIQLGIDNFNVVIVDNAVGKTGVSVDHNGNLIKIPIERYVTKKKMKSLVVHEVITHIMRGIQGEKSRLKLLGLGLGGYLIGEEGLATVRGQAYSGTFNRETFVFDGLAKFLAAGLCVGFDGKPRDFREVYELMKGYFSYRRWKIGVDPARVIGWIEKAAFKVCMRVFRGTDCKTKGVGYLKDMVYTSGNYQIWRLVKKKAEILNFADVGKYDPGSRKHIEWLRELSIID